jgi:hypothetical protein
VGEARRKREGGDRLAVRGRPPVGRERAEGEQPAARLVDGGGGRRIEPFEVARIGDSPQGAVEQERGKVRFQNLGRVEARQGGGRRLLPQAVDGPRRLAAGAAGALGHRRLARPLGHQPGDPRGPVVARPAGEAGVDDDPHAVERQAGLGDRGGENHLAPAGGRCGDGGALGGGIEASVKTVEVGAGGKPVEPLGGPLDLRDSGEEGEKAPLRFGKGGADGRGHLVLDPPLGGPAEMDDLDRMRPSFAGDGGRSAHQGGEPLPVESRRHGEQPQIGAKRRLGVEGEGESEVAVEAALVDLVEQHGGDARKLGIGLDPAPEDAFGEDEYPGAGGAAGVEAGGVADRLAHPLPGQLRHPLGGGPGREAPGREEEDLPGAPGLGEEGGRDGGGLAGARRSDEHGVARAAKGGEKLGQDGVDRKGHRVDP